MSLKLCLVFLAVIPVIALAILQANSHSLVEPVQIIVDMNHQVAPASSEQFQVSVDINCRMSLFTEKARETSNYLNKNKEITQNLHQVCSAMAHQADRFKV